LENDKKANDAIAVAELYERIAKQARAAFEMKNLQTLNIPA